MSKRILIINIFGIGDVLFTTPMIANIKKNIPDSFVGYICNKRVYPILEDNPKIDKIIIYEKDDFRALWKKSKVQCLKVFLGFFNEIKKERFDIVFDLSLNKYEGFFTWLLGIKERIGFNYKNRSPLLTTKINIKGYEDKHVVEHYLGLLEHANLKIGAKRLEVFIREVESQWVKEILKEYSISPKDLLIALIPGGGASWGKDARYRRWPPERHAMLADKIIEKYKAKVILLGDQSEEKLGQKLIASMKHDPISLIGKTTLKQYLALLSRSDLVVVNDGGPLHMAVASGARTVSMIGTVDEKVYGPYPKDGHGIVTKDIPCRPCYRYFHRADCDHISCLNTIEVQEVFEKAEKILSSRT